MKTALRTLAALAAVTFASTGCLDAGPWDEDGQSESSSLSASLKAAPTCRIDGVVYAAGAANPADACQSCEPTIARRTWTVLDATCYEPPPPSTGGACESARDCGSAMACADGACSLDCTSDSQCAAPLHCVPGSGCLL